ncbi:MAG: hypothetical protein H0U75_07735, partial [Legionella sp.]|nr:hypothetical protein [Legionella sp.]
MKNSVELNNLIHQLPVESYEQFGSQLKNKIPDRLSLHVFKDKSLVNYMTQLGNELFKETIKS